MAILGGSVDKGRVIPPSREGIEWDDSILPVNVINVTNRVHLAENIWQYVCTLITHGYMASQASRVTDVLNHDLTFSVRFLSINALQALFYTFSSYFL